MSDAYAYLSFVTAWLKHYYPVEYMASLMTYRENEKDPDTKEFKRNVYIKESKAMGIKISPPKLGISRETWAPIVFKEKDAEGNIGEIRQSLLSISGITENNYPQIRDMDFKGCQSMNDFLSRLETYKVKGIYPLKLEVFGEQSLDDLSGKEEPVERMRIAILEEGIHDNHNPNRDEVWRDFLLMHTKYSDVDSTKIIFAPYNKKLKIGLTKVGIIGLIKSGALEDINENRLELLQEFYALKKEDPIDLPPVYNKEAIIAFETESLGMVMSVQTRFSTIEDDKITQWTGIVQDLESFIAKSSGKKHYRFKLLSSGEEISCLCWGFKKEKVFGAIENGNQVTFKLKKQKDVMIVETVSKNFKTPAELS